MQGNMGKASKTRASKQTYVSQNQLPLPGFETPFHQHLNPSNRWVVLARKIPWDSLVSVYQSQMHNDQTGASGINPRVALGAIIIKHICDLSDEQTILHIQENIYMQYFVGLSSFTNETVFDSSLFVEFRKRLGANQINRISEMILGLSDGGPVGSEQEYEPQVSKVENQDPGDRPPDTIAASGVEEQMEGEQPFDHTGKENWGWLMVDATACPQDISYPTDLNLLSDAREKSEELIDKLYDPVRHGSKPRTYREIARKDYLKTAQKKHHTKKEIRRAVKRQLSYLARNIKSIHRLLAAYSRIPLSRQQYKYLLVIQTLHEQQAAMYKEKSHRVDHRIVSIHQPHVRPIVRGKANARVEFGAKIEVSIMNGYTFLEELSWEAYNESTRLMCTVERYKKRFGCYPKEVLVDRIYCTRENRKKLKGLGIKLKAKPLGRPKAVEVHVRPGERNPMEGKFGQAKSGYGMDRIKARLPQTSQSWICSIVLVLNLVKLAGQVPYWLLQKLLTYSVRWLLNQIDRVTEMDYYFRRSPITVET
jgi:IS5 family transposase